MKHVLLRNPRLKGWEFGMLRAFEDAIVSTTSATVIDIPEYGLKPVYNRSRYGMKFEGVRNFLPKKKLNVEADVIWYILMGPENYELDLFTGWEKVKKKIVYLYDTLPHQFSIIKKLFSDSAFNILITSFHDAVPYLEKITAKKWLAVEQAVPAEIFYPVAETEKSISFSAYGRRLPVFHQVLYDFCKNNKLYYDFTTNDTKHPTAPEDQLYAQYAWHIQHSTFTISWPVEITNPERAGQLNPITCRWFEAATCGTIILGKKPENTLFNDLLHPDLVIEIDPFMERSKLFNQLDKIWEKKAYYQKSALDIALQISHKLTWKNRVEKILEHIAYDTYKN